MWSFVKRHKRKFLIAGGIVGGVIVINKYFSRKFSEWEEAQAKKYIEVRKRQHHFEGTLQTCDSTILSFLPKLREVIEGLVSDEPILQKLKTNPSDKVALWEELKVRIFTHAVCQLYSECLLVVFLRIQLSILGGYMYIDSQHPQCPKDQPRQKCLTTADVQRKYLSLVHNLYNDAVGKIAKDAEEAVKCVIKNVSLKQKVRLKDFEQIIADVKSMIAPEVSHHFAKLLRANKQDDPQLSTSDEAVFSKMIMETADVLENEDFMRVVTECINRGYELLMDRLSECYMSMSQESEDFVNPHCLEVPFAKLLPVIHTTLQQHRSSNENNFVKLLLKSDILKSFSANVYETFSQETKSNCGMGDF